MRHPIPSGFSVRVLLGLAAVAAAVLFLPPPSAFADLGDCGQPQSTGTDPKTSDALAVLKSAVGQDSACDTEPCICDVTGDGKVLSSDALRVLQDAVGQLVELACDCGDACVVLGDDAPALTSEVPGRALDIPVRQVEIEARIVAINLDSYDKLGVDLQITTPSGVSIDAGPGPGGTSGDDRNLAVDSNVTGGPPDLQYFVYGAHPEDGALPILNKSFISPFTAVKSFPMLPFDRCLLFPESAVSEPQSFPNGNPVQNLPPYDPGLGGSQLLYRNFLDNGADLLLDAIASDNRNAVLTAPTLVVYDGQAAIHMVDDIQIPVEQVETDFRTNMQQVTPSPFGIFTGVVLDVVPTIADDEVQVDIRLGTKALSFFLSTAFLVDGVATDAEIPLLQRSRARTTVTVPDGGTLVLGGLLREGETDPERGVPLLGDIPVIGDLFSRKYFDTDEQTLMIFITPMIVD